MAIVWDKLQRSSRLLAEAGLSPVQGERFQPTGFPDLGPATYQLPNGTQMLLVESAQSMANRLESVCWDEARGELQPPLAGMPYVRVKLWDSKQTTNSILEAHRLNSPYIMSDTRFREAFRKEAQVPERGKKGGASSDAGEDEGGAGLFDRRALAKAVFKFDPSAVLHGVFLEKLDGRARLQRCLSAFIEARNVRTVSNGGVKNDHVSPDPAGLKAVGLTVSAKEGFGNVPFHRTEFVAESITACFNLDLAQVRAYGLGQSAEQFLIALAFWKVRRFLESGLRLRTACDLRLVGDLRVTSHEGFQIPDTQELESDLPGLIKKCASERLFSDPPVTELTFRPGK